MRIGGPLGLALTYAALAAAIAGAGRAWRRLGGGDCRAPAAAARAPTRGARGARGHRGRRACLAPALRGSRAPHPGELVVSFLDIGQGDATLLQHGGVSVLFDTGPPGGPILRRLSESGVERLDALVITHAQADHEGMALEIVRAFKPRLVLDGGAGWSTPVQRGLPATRVRTVAAHAGQQLALGSIRLKLLWPPRPPPGWRPEGDPNGRAVVALASVGDFDVLLSADAESDVTGTLPLPDVEVLKVAHHGSDDPGLPALLARTRPELAAIEVGRANTYGHPTPKTLAALEAVVPNVVRTDRDGTVRLRVSGNSERIERSR